VGLFRDRQCGGHLRGMTDQVYLVTLKAPNHAIQQVVAVRYEVRGEHLAFIDAEGRLAALFLMEIVQSWIVLPGPGDIDAAISTKPC
jgi:hypothetical protein